MKKDFFTLTVFLIVATVISLLAGELAVRAISSYTLIYNLEMVKYAKELKTRDPEGLVSHIHKSNAAARLMGVDIRLNSLGNRSPELSAKKAPGEYRALVIGSSVTMGWGVPAEKVFTAIAEKKLNADPTSGRHISIINAGIGNYNLQAQYQLFKRQFSKLDPDAVVLHYFLPDARPQELNVNNWVLQNSFLADYFYNALSATGLKFETGHGVLDFYRELYRDGSQPWLETIATVRKLREDLQASHRKFAIIIFPDLHDLSANSPYLEIYQKIQFEFEKLGVPVKSWVPEFQKTFGGHETDAWVQRDDPHLNSKGHELMAEEFYNFLVNFLI